MRCACMEALYSMSAKYYRENELIALDILLSVTAPPARQRC